MKFILGIVQMAALAFALSVMPVESSAFVQVGVTSDIVSDFTPHNVNASNDAIVFEVENHQPAVELQKEFANIGITTLSDFDVTMIELFYGADTCNFYAQIYNENNEQYCFKGDGECYEWQHGCKIALNPIDVVPPNANNIAKETTFTVNTVHGPLYRWIKA